MLSEPLSAPRWLLPQGRQGAALVVAELGNVRCRYPPLELKTDHPTLYANNLCYDSGRKLLAIISPTSAIQHENQLFSRNFWRSVLGKPYRKRR